MSSSADSGESLAGLRILLVEDEGAISLLLESLLEAAGCAVVGPASSLVEAQRLAEAAQIDLALLDVNVGGHQIYPVAERLSSRRIPIIFSTGYGPDGLDPRWKRTPVLVKPFTARQLESMLRRTLRDQSPIVVPD